MSNQPEQSEQPGPARRNNTRDRNFFEREPDGSVRLRIRFDPEDADMIELAAGDTPLVLWLHRQWKAAARRQIEAASQSRPDVAPPT